MKKLIELIEKRKKIGAKKSCTKGGNYNDIVEYKRLGELILKEVTRLYDDGKLK